MRHNDMVQGYNVKIHQPIKGKAMYSLQEKSHLYTGMPQMLAAHNHPKAISLYGEESRCVTGVLLAIVAHQAKTGDC